jgi:hypothetical protein
MTVDMPHLDAPLEPLTVAQFRGVVQDQFDTFLANTRYATPIARLIARSQCEDVLVDHYAAAALVVVERDQLWDTLQRFEAVLDSLIEAGA